MIPVLAIVDQVSRAVLPKNNIENKVVRVRLREKAVDDDILVSVWFHQRDS